MERMAGVFRALADESRLRILNLLFRTGELCVCDIESTTGFTQTKVSRHLSYLRNAGLVDCRQQGLWMLYSIARPRNNKHKELLDFLKTVLESNAVARRDARELAKNIRKGCCATFSVVKPKQIPVTLKLN
jgi:ArsR family transcriptional regulator